MTVNKNRMAVFSTKWINYTAILTALVVATGYIPPIPTPAGRIYWVDGIVLLAAYLMDPISAFICGGVGTLIYDIFKSPEMMLASLLIHGLQGAIASALLHFVLPNRFKKYEWAKAVIFSVIAAVEVVLGYFIYRCITRGVPVAAASIPRNIIQEAIGISIAVIICYATTFKKQLERAGLLPDFKRELLQISDNAETAKTVESTDTAEK